MLRPRQKPTTWPRAPSTTRAGAGPAGEQRRGFRVDPEVRGPGSWGAGASLGRAPTASPRVESKGPRASPGD